MKTLKILMNALFQQSSHFHKRGLSYPTLLSSISCIESTEWHQPKTNKTNPICVAFHCIFQFPSQVSPEKHPWADDCRIAFLWFDALEALRSAVGCELQSHWWRGFVLCWCKRPGNCQATSLQSSPGKTWGKNNNFFRGIKRWVFCFSLHLMSGSKKEWTKQILKTKKKTSPID